MIWLIAYDVTMPKRLRRVSKLCRHTGLRRIQKSVYAGELSQEQIIYLRELLIREIQPDEDRILLLPVTRNSIKASVTLGLDCSINELLEQKNFLFI